jgi:hypothetical protein
METIDIQPLAVLCREQSVDQEFFSESQISKWWDAELKI